MAITPSAPSGLPPVPASNKANTFPAKYLSNERLLLETKPLTTPTLIAIFVVAVLFGSITLFLFTISSGYTFGVIVLFLGFLVILPLLSHYWLLTTTHYAITDQRVIVVVGRLSKRSVSVTHDQITAIEVIEPWLAKALFGIGSIRYSVPSFSYSTILWSNIRDAQGTLNFVVQARHFLSKYGTFKGYMTQASMIGGAVAANLGQAKQCWNCKLPLRPTARFCRACGARQP